MPESIIHNGFINLKSLNSLETEGLVNFDLATTKLYTPEYMKRVSLLNNLSTIIQDIYNNMCKPLSSLPNKFKYKEIKFKRNITLEKSIEILQKYKFTLLNLVINYDNKVIGLYIEKNKLKGFIPCFPSGIISKYALLDLNDEIFLKNMEETLQFLNMVLNETNKEILCNPVVKVLEDKLIIGLLTETNQLIPLIEPELDTDKNIKHSIDDDNFFQVNKITQMSTKKDTVREEYVKKIKLETDLFNSFRNKLRT